LITIEAGLSGRSLILGDDGFIRDISGLSGSYKKAEPTEKAIRLMIDAIKILKPSQTLFFFDAPISRSGELAQEVRNHLKREEIPGDAMAVKVPEKILIEINGVIATSDTALIDQVPKVFDLAGHILKKRIGLRSILHFFPTRKKRPK
jgi:hypothetical protein